MGFRLSNEAKSPRRIAPNWPSTDWGRLANVDIEFSSLGRSAAVLLVELCLGGLACCGSIFVILCLAA